MARLKIMTMKKAALSVIVLNGFLAGFAKGANEGKLYLYHTQNCFKLEHPNYFHI